MATASQALAKFAAELKFSDIPREVVERAKDCMINTVGIATFGAQMPWSQMMSQYALRKRRPAEAQEMRVEPPDGCPAQ